MSAVDAGPSSAHDLKKDANALYAQGLYSRSIALYTRAISISPLPTLYSNRSAAHFMLQDYAAALKDCLSALDGEPGLVKLYVRGARSAAGLGRIDQGVQVLRKGVEAFTSAKELSHLEVVMKEVCLFFIVFWMDGWMDARGGTQGHSTDASHGTNPNFNNRLGDGNRPRNKTHALGKCLLSP